ncbi:hypothetical protein ACIRL2_44725 [Embleya sp. NPDC127516]|uniref:hypothetical protein n=1 Tax=Embleya sp. NPDC127516 TaxID=3363990 RepID=UPI003818FBDC
MRAGRPAGAADRSALPPAGDDAAAEAAEAPVDAIGLDVNDAGPLAEGRAFRPGSAVYNVYGRMLDAATLRAGLGL